MSNTVNSPNCGHFGAQAFVLYLESVLYSGGGFISSPIGVVITVVMLFDIKESFKATMHACRKFRLCRQCSIGTVPSEL